MSTPSVSTAPMSTGPVRRSRLRRTVGQAQFRFGLAILVLSGLWYAIFVYRPIIRGLWMSLLNYQVVNPSASTFVGLRNFGALFGYDRFWIAVGNTLLYTVLTYLLSMPAAILLSWCIANVKKGRRFYEFVVFLPVVVSLVAIALLFRMLMNPDFGLINTVLRGAGLPTSDWIFASESALFSVVLVDVWKGLGFYVVLLTAAMLAVPQGLYDAAKVDGAGGWAIFRQITVPTIMPTLALVSIFTIFSGLQVYVSPTVLGPGPGTSTLMLNQFIVDQAFASFNLGLATAASLVLFAFVLVLSIVQLRIMKPRT
jgi:ABC-type sugar transport system permease subunit